MASQETPYNMFPATACPKVCAKSGNTRSCALLRACLPLLLCCFSLICKCIYSYQTTGQHEGPCLWEQSSIHIPALNVSLRFFLFWTCSYIVFHALVVLLLLNLCCRKKKKSNFLLWKEDNLILISLPSNNNKIIRNKVSEQLTAAQKVH